MPDEAPLSILPLGTIDLAEVEAAAKRAGRNLGLVVEVRKPVSLPAGHFDPARSQSHAVRVIGAVPAVHTPPPRAAPGTTADPTATRAAALSPSESWGSRAQAPQPAGSSSGREPQKSTALAIRIGVTDADLFSEKRDFVFVFAEPAYRRAIVSTRRLKEAFWKRKSDPPRQQNRLVRELVGAVALAAGAPPCEDPDCAAYPAKSPLDIDRKTDRLCPNCDRRVRGGVVRY